ncbi:MAG: cupin domain-containing protein [Solirubrobacteraceae bacterium]
MGIAHFDDAGHYDVDLGHLRGRWSFVGAAAGSVGVGARRIEVPAGAWSTPAHEHGREEEIFYVLGGRGLSWHAGSTAPIAAGDCLVHRPGSGAHTLRALDPLDVLAFGPRLRDESPWFPRLGIAFAGRRAVETLPEAVGPSVQFLREAELGPPDLPLEPGSRPANIVNLEAVTADRLERPRVVRTRRNLGRAAGSVTTGLQHVEVAPGKESSARHCHSVEEEIFVILAGDGALELDGEETPVRPGHVVARPPGTGVAHVFRAGTAGLTYLAYGTRDPADLCYYPRSNKIAFRGLGVIGRLERLDYWDGED